MSELYFRKCFATDGSERDLVAVFNLFAKNKPEKMNQDFYLSVKQHQMQTRSPPEKAGLSPALLTLTSSARQESKRQALKSPRQKDINPDAK